MEVFVATWNVGNTMVEPAELDAWLRGATKDASVVVIALQEAHYITDKGKEEIEARAAATGFLMGLPLFCLGLVACAPLMWDRRKKRLAREKKERLEKELLMNPAMKASQRKALVCVDVVTRLVDCLEGREFTYCEDASCKWGQMRLLVFHKEALVHLEPLKTAISRTGGKVTNNDMHTGVLGNKGGLISSFAVEPADRRGVGDHVERVLLHGADDVHKAHSKRKTVTAIGVHLPAHEGDKHLEDRKEALATILKTARDDALLDDSQLCLLTGDMNFRLATQADSATVAGDVADGDYGKYYPSDELQIDHERPASVVEGWELPKCDFPPTFKVKRGVVAETYNPKRIPAWCDRVLYKSTLNLHLISYGSHKSVTTSDHKPVALRLDVLDKKSPQTDQRDAGDPPDSRRSSLDSDADLIDPAALAHCDLDIRVFDAPRR